MLMLLPECLFLFQRLSHIYVFRQASVFRGQSGGPADAGAARRARPVRRRATRLLRHHPSAQHQVF